MRFASIILALIVTFFSIIPCDSDCGELTEVESELHSHNEHSEPDLCSPFCSCNCCQSNFELIDAIEGLYIPYFSKRLESRVAEFQVNSTFELWKPPKV